MCEVDEPAVGSTFDARQSLAPNRVGNDDARLARRKGQMGERIVERGERVAVDPYHASAECFELGSEGFERDELLGANIGLKLVAVHDADEVVESARRRDEQGFPHRSLVELAVAQDDEHAIWPAAQLDVDGNADRHADEMSERSRMKLYARHTSVRMPVETVVDVEVVVEPLAWKVP